MSLVSSTPFFTVKWKPPISPGLLPASAKMSDEPFMTVGWQAKPGAVYYPFEREKNAKPR